MEEKIKIIQQRKQKKNNSPAERLMFHQEKLDFIKQYDFVKFSIILFFVLFLREKEKNIVSRFIIWFGSMTQSKS